MQLRLNMLIFTFITCLKIQCTFLVCPFSAGVKMPGFFFLFRVMEGILDSSKDHVQCYFLAFRIFQQSLISSTQTFFLTSCYVCAILLLNIALVIY